MVGLAAKDRSVNTFVLTLLNLPGVGARTVQRILEEKRGSIESAELLNGSFALTLGNRAVQKALLFNPVSPDDENDARAREVWDDCEAGADGVVERANGGDISILNPYMDEYPQRLLRNKNYPPILYCRGDVSTLNEEKSVAIVGTREPTDYGRKAGARLAQVLAEDGYVVVSGLALGCDTAAHEGALEAHGKTVAVLPTPIDAPVYPSQNQDLADRIVSLGGALVSEYAPGEALQGKQLVNNLVARDEWQPALADGLIAVETSTTGGTNHALSHASKTGTPIAVFDHSWKLGDEFRADERFGGNVVYLNQGACPISNSASIEAFKEMMEAYRKETATRLAGGFDIDGASQMTLQF